MQVRLASSYGCTITFTDPARAGMSTVEPGGRVFERRLYGSRSRLSTRILPLAINSIHLGIFAGRGAGALSSEFAG